MVNQDALKLELSSLADLQIRLNDKGGPSFDGELFEKVLENQGEILSRFGLVSIPENEKLLCFDQIPSQEELIERITELHNRASIYLLSDTKSELEILKEAQEFRQEANVVLPELKITTHLYTFFVFNEILLKNQDTLDNILNELKIANSDENLNALGRLIFEDDEKLRGEKYTFLLKKDLKYIDEFMRFFLPNSEELKRTIHFYQSSLESISNKSDFNQNTNSEIEGCNPIKAKTLSEQKDIANKLITKFLANKSQLGYINLNNENKYEGWVSNFHISCSKNGENMSLDFTEEKDKFLLFVLAVVWSRTGHWENAAFFVTYLKFNKKNDPKYWQSKSNIAYEITNKKLSTEKLLKDVKSLKAPRKQISFREDIFESIHILANNWEDILSTLTSSYESNNYVTFMIKMRGIDGLAGPGRKMSIKIPLILRELRCQKVFDNIPGEFCCVADNRVVKACKKIGITLPIVKRDVDNLIKVSTKIYELFGDLYDLPLFAVEDIS